MKCLKRDRVEEDVSQSTLHFIANLVSGENNIFKFDLRGLLDGEEGRVCTATRLPETGRGQYVRRLLDAEQRHRPCVTHCRFCEFTHNQTSPASLTLCRHWSPTLLSSRLPWRRSSSVPARFCSGFTRQTRRRGPAGTLLRGIRDCGSSALDRLADSTYRLADNASALSQRFTRLPRNVSSRSGAAAIEHAERKNSEGHIDESFLQVVSRAERRLQCFAKLFFSGFRDVLE